MADDGVSKHIWQLGNLYLYECPPLWITQDTWDLLDAIYIFENKNLLPFHGLWTEQPAWFIQAYKIYRNEYSDHIDQIKAQED